MQPIFRGELTSVHLSNKGTGYGTNDVINFNKLPEVSVRSGRNAQASNPLFLLMEKLLKS